MATPAEIQLLLRFLSQDAKIPLATAMGKIKELQASDLTSVLLVSKASPSALKTIFGDEKLAKQVLAAAKRISKKRPVDDDSVSPSTKRKRRDSLDIQDVKPKSPKDIEAALAIPVFRGDESEIADTTVFTNRAPLFLAFAFQLLKYTMPDQPPSSKLSLAQAVVSLNSRSKAASIGLESGKSAIDEGWGRGQPVVNIMGREVPCLKRWGYDWKSQDSEAKEKLQEPEMPSLWGLDTEARRSVAGSVTKERKDSNQLPIHRAEPARDYLLKSFLDPPESEDGAEDVKSASTQPKLTGKALARKKEENLGRLLAALDLLFASYAPFLGGDELNRKAWACYIQVRPEVAGGVAGWGSKGKVSLKSILDLRRVRG